MKKRSLLLLLLLFVVFAFVGVKDKVSAATSDNGNASYDVTSSTTNAFAYTIHQTSKSYTLLGTSSYDQQVNVFTQKQTENSKVVTWAVQTGTGFKLSTLVKIAEDYEAKHPEWKVVGGINADQYFTKTGSDGTRGFDYFAPQPYYPMIADGETWFGTTGYVNSSSGSFVGIKTDGSEDSLFHGTANIHNGDTKLTGLYLSILDNDGNVVNKFKLQGLNQEPNDNEATLHMPYIVDTDKTVPSIEVTGSKLYVVEDAEQAYVNNTVAYESYKPGNALDSAFGRGTVTSIKTTATLKNGQFAINSKNAAIDEALSAGMKIRVQYEFPGEMNTVESAIGFHTVQRQNGADIASNAAYNTKKYPRALIGRTNKGEIVLIAVDGNQAAKGMNGTSHDETNAILKHYGCVDAYQMDGGGSVTAIVRNAEGKFVVTNSPSDGSTRSILSGLLVVERRTPELEIDTTGVKSNTAKINVKVTNDYNYKYNKMYFEIGSKTYDVVDGVCSMTGLRPNSEMKYNIRIDTDDKEGIIVLSGTFKTTPILPSLTKCVLKDLTFTFTIRDSSKILTDKYLMVGDTKYPIEDTTVTVTSLDDIPVLVLAYDCGDGVILEEIKYPQSVFLRTCDQMNNRSFLDGLLK